LTAITDLKQLLAGLLPRLERGEYTFCSVPEDETLPAWLEPLATVREPEGLSLVVSVEAAARAGLDGAGSFRLISLGVLSSLNAVGLTAAVAHALASKGISANVVAGYHHDYIFVPAERADAALAALAGLARESRRGAIR